MSRIPIVTMDHWRELYQASLELKALKPWEFLEDSQLFGIQHPDHQEVGYACILGRLGEVFALCVYRGADGFNMHQRILTGEVMPETHDLFALQNCLMAEFVDRKELERADVEIIQALNLLFRGRKAWPLFRSHLPGYIPWYLTASEVTFLNFALRAAAHVTREVKAHHLNLEARPGYVFTLSPNATQKHDMRNCECRWEPQPPLQSEAPHALLLDPAELEHISSTRLKPDSPWQADTFFMPTPILDRERPYLPRVVLVAHETSGYILGSEIVPPDVSPIQALGNTVLKMIAEYHRLPATLFLRDVALVKALAPLEKKLGLQLTRKKNLKAITEARTGLRGWLNQA